MPFDADDALVPPPNPDDDHAVWDFDATVADDLPDPVPSSDGPEVVQEPPAEAGEDEDASPAEPEPPEEPEGFDERYKDPFKGLLWLGYLEREWTWNHHSFRIVTPTRRVRIQIGLAIQEHKDSPTWEMAWQAAVVAGFLVSVDGIPLPGPVLKNSDMTAFTERYNWVIDNLYDPVIDEVYVKCFELWGKVDNTMAAMKKASG